MKKIIALIACTMLIISTRAQIAITPIGPVVTCGGSTVLSTDTYIPNFLPALADDWHSDTLSIGFPFNFYGTTYNQFVLSANGYITFDLAKANTRSEYQLTSFLPLSQRGIPDNAAATKSICGIYTDILLPRGGTLSYGVAGVAPNRKMIVEFCHVYMFNAARCGTQWATFQIILYEGTNNIEIHIFHRDNCGLWNNGYGCVGIENGLGTGDWPPGRNVPTIWDVNIPEAYRYTPVGSSYVRSNIPYAPIPGNSSISWYKGSTWIGSGPSITVAPATTTTYTAKVTGCDGVVAEAFKTVEVTAPVPPDPINGDSTLCQFQTKIYTDAKPAGVWSTGSSNISINSSTGEVTGITPGSATITYTVTNPPCPPVSVSKTIVIKPAPIIHTSYTPRPLCSGVPYTVYANASDGMSASGCPACSYDWSWTSGGSAHTATGSLDLLGNITPCNISVPYTVSVTNSLGCSNSAMQPVDIYAPANAGTITGPSVACGTDVITLTDVGSNAYCLPSSWTITRINSLGGGTGTFGITLVPDPGDNSKAVMSCGDVPCITIVDLQFKVYSDSCGDDTANFRVIIKPKPKFVSASVISCNPICPGIPISVQICGTPGAKVHYIYTWPGCIPVSDSVTMPYGACGTNVCTTVLVPAPSGPCAVTTGMFTFDLGIMELNGCTTLIGTSRTVQVEYPWANIELVGPAPCMGSPFSLKITGTKGARVWLFPEYMPYDTAMPYPTFVDLPMSGTDAGVAYIHGLVIPPPVVGGMAEGKNTFCIRQVDADSTCGGCSVHWAETYESELSHPLPCINVIAREIPYVTLTTSGPVCAGRPFLLIGSYYPLGGEPVTTHELDWDGWKDGYYTGWHSSPGDLIDTITAPTDTGVYIYHLTATGDNGCTNTATLAVSVNPNPPSIVEILGPSPICEGEILILRDANLGGTWSSSSPTVVEILSTWETSYNSFSKLNGLHYGTSTLTYTATNGCYSTKDITVNRNPHIKGDLFMCSIGISSPLYPDMAGGTWYSDHSSIVSVDPATGWVTSVAVGSTTITYTLPSGCYGTIHITVIDGMTPITGYSYGCGIGSTIDLANATVGGTWWSSDEDVATVSTTGEVTFTGLGVATIYYCLNPQYGSTSYPVGMFTGCCAQYTVRNIPPDVGCEAGTLVGTEWYYRYHINDLTIYDTVILHYTENISMTGSLPCSPGPGPGLFTGTYGPVAGLGGSVSTYTLPMYSSLYPGAPCIVSNTTLDSITVDGCTWPVSCYAASSKPGHSSSDTGNVKGTLSGGIWNVIPNPNKGVFTLSGYLKQKTATKHANIQIVDMLGKILFTDEVVVENGVINKSVILNENIGSGVYLIRINSGDQSEVVHFTLYR